jgi:hypothetical protein
VNCSEVGSTAELTFLLCCTADGMFLITSYNYCSPLDQSASSNVVAGKRLSKQSFAEDKEIMMSGVSYHRGMFCVGCIMTFRSISLQ